MDFLFMGVTPTNHHSQEGTAVKVPAESLSPANATNRLSKCREEPDVQRYVKLVFYQVRTC
jgi:hypothetical protein